MKKIVSLSAIAFGFLLATLQVSVTSCTKETITHDTVTVITKDTIVELKIDTVKLVKNSLPVVNAGSDTVLHLTSVSDSLRLHGTATDADSAVVAYLWSQVSGPNTALLTNPGSALTYVTHLDSGKYVFQLMVVDSDGAVGVKTVSVTVTLPQIYTLVMQPDGAQGQDAIVATRAADGGAVAGTNLSSIAELSLSQWTYNAQNAGEGTNRTYIKFTELSNIPAGSEVLSAKLSLYGLTEAETALSPSTPQGNSFYSGSPYTASNKGWIKRVTGGDWNEATITWANRPAATDTNRVAIPASTAQYNYNVTNLDVTKLVKDLVRSNYNYGFRLQQQSEQVYRSLLFASSEHPDAARRPKLVVQYRK
ncbi:MAG TPA: DNRLRE domain-containing protein [Chitinophagaceae bacterium]|nr:DNRLRE domain-containing protein [Chitinophagaceae bacterium]